MIVSFNRTIVINMKKVIVPLVILISFSFAQQAFSQSKSSSRMSGDNSPMQVGSVFVNGGIGFGANYYSTYNYGTAFGFKIAAEFGLWQAGPGVITLGPEIGGSFSTGAYGYLYNGNGTNNTFVVAGRGAWHFGWNVPNLDTYGGVSAGIGFNHYSYYDNNYLTANRVIPAFGGFVGASYFIKPNFGFNAEAGYDITFFQVGVVLKIQ
jgi:hypothetical protein